MQCFWIRWSPAISKAPLKVGLRPLSREISQRRTRREAILEGPVLQQMMPHVSLYEGD